MPATRPVSSVATRRAPAVKASPRPFTAEELRELEEVMEMELRATRRAAQGSETTLRDQLEASGRLGGDVTDSSIDMAAAEAANIGVRRAHSQIEALTAALVRLRARPDQFGICETCRERIAFERLEVVPTTAFCARHSRS